MSKCVSCGKDNHSGCDVCNACQEAWYEQQYYEEQQKQEEQEW